MTKEFLITALELLVEKVKDKEIAHPAADKMLLDYINDPEIKAAYDKVGKWYA